MPDRVCCLCSVNAARLLLLLLLQSSQVTRSTMNCRSWNIFQNEPLNVSCRFDSRLLRIFLACLLVSGGGVALVFLHWSLRSDILHN